MDDLTTCFQRRWSLLKPKLDAARTQKDAHDAIAEFWSQLREDYEYSLAGEPNAPAALLLSHLQMLLPDLVATVWPERDSAGPLRASADPARGARAARSPRDELPGMLGKMKKALGGSTAGDTAHDFGSQRSQITERQLALVMRAFDSSVQGAAAFDTQPTETKSDPDDPELISLLQRMLGDLRRLGTRFSVSTGDVAAALSRRGLRPVWPEEAPDGIDAFERSYDPDCHAPCAERPAIFRDDALVLRGLLFLPTTSREQA